MYDSNLMVVIAELGLIDVFADWILQVVTETLIVSLCWTSQEV